MNDNDEHVTSSGQNLSCDLNYQEPKVQDMNHTGKLTAMQGRKVLNEICFYEMSRGSNVAFRNGLDSTSVTSILKIQPHF